MARQTIAASTPAGPYPATLPITANSADVTMTAADVANKSQTAFGVATALLLLVQNTHASAAGDITIESAPDGLNRVGNITDYVLQAGDIAAFYLPRNGWRQSDGNLYFDGSDVTIKFAIIKL
jgi:hypothetical protein